MWLNKLRLGFLRPTAQSILEPVTGSAIPLPISHYLYFQTEEAATNVAAELDRRGFRTDTKLSANKDLWLVLARHEIHPTPERLAELRVNLDRIASEAGGEYDGWEAKLAEH